MSCLAQSLKFQRPTFYYIGINYKNDRDLMPCVYVYMHVGLDIDLLNLA